MVFSTNQSLSDSNQEIADRYNQLIGVAKEQTDSGLREKRFEHATYALARMHLSNPDITQECFVQLNALKNEIHPQLYGRQVAQLLNCPKGTNSLTDSLQNDIFAEIEGLELGCGQAFEDLCRPGFRFKTPESGQRATAMLDDMYDRQPDGHNKNKAGWMLLDMHDKHDKNDKSIALMKKLSAAYDDEALAEQLAQKLTGLGAHKRIALTGRKNYPNEDIVSVKVKDGLALMKDVARSYTDKDYKAETISPLGVNTMDLVSILSGDGGIVGYDHARAGNPEEPSLPLLTATDIFSRVSQKVKNPDEPMPPSLFETCESYDDVKDVLKNPQNANHPTVLMFEAARNQQQEAHQNSLARKEPGYHRKKVEEVKNYRFLPKS